MPWCPNCKTEYLEGIKKCPSCGVELSSELPSELMEQVPASWSYEGEDDNPEWPLDKDGAPVPPVLLTKVLGFQIDYDMKLSLLRAFKIPCVYSFPGAGPLVKVLFGFSGTGMDIYVPETMLEDAKNIISAEAED
jgi:hypothetical protein